MRAYNAGDARALDKVFAPDPQFEWYFDQRQRGSKGTTIRVRAQLLPYFDERHSKGDSFDVVELDVRTKRGWHGGFDFEYLLDRKADDIVPGEYHGKGAADCTISVWAFGASAP